MFTADTTQKHGYIKPHGQIRKLLEIRNWGTDLTQSTPYSMPFFEDRGVILGIQKLTQKLKEKAVGQKRRPHENQGILLSPNQVSIHRTSWDMVWEAVFFPLPKKISLARLGPCYKVTAWLIC